MTSQAHETLTSFRTVEVGSNRRFGLIVGALLCALGVLPMVLHRHPVRWWLVAPGIVLVALGAVAPALLGPVNRLWFRFGLLLGRITNPLVMGVLFFGVLAPIGWVLRRQGKDLLALKRDPGAASYWIARDAPPSSLTKQF